MPLYVICSSLCYLGTYVAGLLCIETSWQKMLEMVLNGKHTCWAYCHDVKRVSCWAWLYHLTLSAFIFDQSLIERSYDIFFNDESKLQIWLRFSFSHDIFGLCMRFNQMWNILRASFKVKHWSQSWKHVRVSWSLVVGWLSDPHVWGQGFTPRSWCTYCMYQECPRGGNLNSFQESVQAMCKWD